MIAGFKVPYVLLLAIMAVSYFAFAEVGFSLTFMTEHVSAAWPASGIAVAALLIGGYRLWPGIWLGAFVSDVLHHEQSGIASGVALGHTLAPLLAVVLLRRFSSFDARLRRLRDLTWLVLFGAIAMTVSAAIGTLSLSIGGIVPWSHAVVVAGLWWASDTVGVLTLTPLVLTWTTPTEQSRRSGAREFEPPLFVAVLLISSWALFASRLQLKYSVYPLIIWAALRFGQRTTALSAVLISALALLGAKNHLGPFVASSSVDQTLVQLATFLSQLSITGLLLSTLTVERRELLSNVEEAAMLTAVFESNPDAIIVMDKYGRIVNVNGRTVVLFKRSQEALLGEAVDLLIPNFLRTYHEIRSEPSVTPTTRTVASAMELVALRADGTIFPIGVTISSMPFGPQQLTIAIVRDVTDRNLQEQLLRTTLREAETLLKEVYHRVKNNLQVIRSLLNIHARTLPAGPGREAMEEAGTRISAMALVHEKLYRSGTLAHISLSEYVGDLLTQIRGSTGMDSRRITLTTDLADIEVGLDTAIPLGLLLNELVSNSIKHAFPHDRNGEIVVSILAADHGAKLSVADDGIGIPNGFDIRQTKSMGLRLADSLARQLGGKLAITSIAAGGASFSVDVHADHAGGDATTPPVLVSK